MIEVITSGSRSPPTRCFTAPSFSETIRTVLLSLSATKRQFQGSSEARERPEGWAKPALWGYALFRFSSFPLPANRRQVPFFKSLRESKYPGSKISLKQFRQKQVSFSLGNLFSICKLST